jgi:virginiamycin B lyase
VGIAVVLTAVLIVCVILVSTFNNKREESQNILDGKTFALGGKIGNESNKIDTILILNKSTHISTPYIKEYSMPNGTWPNGILVSKKTGMVWTVGTKSHTLLSFDPKQGKIRSIYFIPENRNIITNNNNDHNILMTWSMLEDNNGSIWFSQEDSPNPLWQFDPSTEKFRSIQLISGAPHQMKIDKKTGNIWFTTFTDGKLGVVQKAERKTITDDNNDISSKYNVTEFDLGKESFPSGLFLDGNSIWITQSSNNKLVQYKIITDTKGTVVNIVKALEFPIFNDQKVFDEPYDVLAFGNKLWLTEHDASLITEYNIESNNITKFATSMKFNQYINSKPFWIREGPKDGFWFNEHYGNRMAFFNTTDMTLTEYEIPTRDPFLGYIANVLNFAVDPSNSNNVWFSEYDHDKIGMIDGSISIPFDIRSSINKVNLLKSINLKVEQKQQKFTFINFEILKNTQSNNILNQSGYYNNNNNHEIVFFGTSSSMTSFGTLNSTTADFNTDYVDLTKIKEKRNIQLILKNDFISQNPSSSHSTLGISATDGRVTKSIFLR